MWACDVAERRRGILCKFSQNNSRLRYIFITPPHLRSSHFFSLFLIQFGNFFLFWYSHFGVVACRPPPLQHIRSAYTFLITPWLVLQRANVWREIINLPTDSGSSSVKGKSCPLSYKRNLSESRPGVSIFRKQMICAEARQAKASGCLFSRYIKTPLRSIHLVGNWM